MIEELDVEKLNQAFEQDADSNLLFEENDDDRDNGTADHHHNHHT